MMPDLKSKGQGRPNVGTEPVFQELTDYEWSDWSEAKLIEVIKYLRGNVNLRLPEEWKQCFPTRL